MYLTNWPSFVRNDQNYIEKSHILKPIANNDWGTLSYYNISGSAANDTFSRAIQIGLLDAPGNGVTPTSKGTKAYSEAELNALTPLLTQTGSGADIPFVTLPAAPRNIPDLYPATGSDWNVMFVGVGPDNEHKFFYTRDEPCEYETRSNFAFINKWGVWDFIGLNTPTNKNAVISKRNGFQSVNNDYNAAVSLYSPYNRGFEQYYLNQDYKYKIATEYMGSVDSSFYGDFSIENFYQELFISPNVMLQVGDKFVPINLSNSKFVFKTNKKGQKKYAVEIQYEFSNKPRSRT